MVKTPKNPLFNLSWIPHFVESKSINPSARAALVEFWTKVFEDLLLCDVFSSDEVSLDEESRIQEIFKQKEFYEFKMKEEFKERVFQMLEDGKKKKLSYKEKRELQHKIESLTMSYNEESIYHTQPELMKLFMNSHLPSAQDFLTGKFKFQKTWDNLSRVKKVPYSKTHIAEEPRFIGIF